MRVQVSGMSTTTVETGQYHYSTTTVETNTNFHDICKPIMGHGHHYIFKGLLQVTIPVADRQQSAALEDLLGPHVQSLLTHKKAA